MQYAAVLEPVGVCRDDGKRPDGMSLIPWRRGLPLLWDFTCSDTLVPSHLATCVHGAGRLADSSEAHKRRKYSSLTATFHFSPVSLETLGAWGSSARELIKIIGSRVMERIGDVHATRFLIQQVSLDIQHGNVASVMATIPPSSDWAEFISLPPL